MIRHVVVSGIAALWISSEMLAVQPPSAGVPAERLEGQKIAAIHYTPAETLDPADLAKAQTLRAGDLFHVEAAAKAIDSLFATGWFADIAVEAETSSNGLIIRFVTKPNYFVGGVSVTGKHVSPPNRGQIANSGQFTLGAQFREEDIKTAVENMRTLLHANGLHEAEIIPTVERDENVQQVFLTFQVKGGRRAKYEQPVLTGNTMLSDNTILRATGWRIPLIHWWRQVTDSRTRKGVQAVLAKYQNKERLTARVELTKLDYDAETRRVRPSLDITPGPKVQVKAVEANLSKRVLRRYVPIYEERAVYTDLLVEGKRNLQDYLQSKGYYDVEVDFRITGPANEVETIEYVISQGQRHKLTRLTINGNKYFTTAAIRERMFIAPASFNLRRGRYSEAFRRKDEENISNLYKSNGFQDVKVTSTVDRSFGGKAGLVAVTLNIEEGAQWLVDNVTLNGVQQVDRQTLYANLTSTARQPFAEVNMERDRSDVLTYYFTQGFRSAAMKAEWVPSGIPHHVNITYTVQEGSRDYVQEVLISGLRTTRRSLIDKEITLKPGAPLSSPKQAEIQKRFYDLGVFARVDTAVENPEGGTSHKYVLYNFEEANRYNVALGLGAQVARFGTPSTTSLNAPAGQTGFSPQVSLDVSRLNFLGMGQTVSLRGLYSSIEKRASISYLQPRFRNSDGRNITYSLLYDNALNVRTFASKRQEASVQLSQKFSKSLTGLFRFSYRKVSVSNVIIPVLLVPQLIQPVRIGIFSANVSQDRRDNPGDPHRGIYNTADIGISTKYFGSQRSFGRVLLRDATYHRITPTMVLARQTQFGLILPFSAPSGVSEQQSVPLPERFFGGGADSLRAFSFNQAGPRDIGMPLVSGGPASQATGFPLGGNALFFNNVELRVPFIGENIQGVLFHDMGNVFSSIGNISLRFHQRDLQDFNYTVHAVGFGVRYRTPVGPIRLDLAYSINPPSFNGFSGTPQELLQCNPSDPASSRLSFCKSTKQNSGHFQFFFSIGQAF